MHFMPTPSPRSQAFALAVLLCVLNQVLPVQATPKSAARYYEDAHIKFESGDNKAAVIQLKNALQQDPNMLLAHILLGKIYAQEEAAAAAEEELLKAKQLGADPSLTVLDLAHVYLLQKKYDQVLTAFRPQDFPPPIQAELQVKRGFAHIALGNYGEAEKSFTAARELDPQSASALIGQATLKFKLGQMDKAAALAEQAVTLAPRDAAAWALKANLSDAQGKQEQALEEYTRTIALRPDQLDARLARVRLYLQSGRDREALEDVDYLRQKFPKDPRAAYFRAVILKRQNRTQEAKESLMEAATLFTALDKGIANEQLALLLVGGLTHAELNQPEKARDYLERYLERQPGQMDVRKLLASIMLSSGDYDGVITLLTPYASSHADDAKLLYLLGNAQMHKGRHKEAQTLLEKAVQASEGAPEIRTELALNKLVMGFPEQAIADLNAVFSESQELNKAGIFLAFLHFRRGEYAEAARVAEKIVAAQPNNLTALNLLASSQMQMGELATARQNFTKALAMAGDFMPAKINLGKLLVVEGKPEAAATYFQTMLKERPHDLQIMIELARIAERQGQDKAAIDWLEKARAADAKAIPPRLYLIERLLAAHRATEALTVAQETEQIEPENLDVLDALARANLAVGKPAIAQVILRNVARRASRNAARLYRTATLLLAANDTQYAAWTLQDAIKANPDFLPAHIMLAEVRLRDGQMAEAESAIAALRNRFPEAAAGLRLLGDMQAVQKQYPQAAANYRAAFEREPSAQLAVRLYRASRLAGEGKAALASIERWNASGPGDIYADNVLADAYLGEGELEKARQLYEKILHTRPNQPRVLNNLAIIAHRTGDPRALEYVQKAYALAADDPLVNDTLGWILTRAGKPDEALLHLRNALIRQGDNAAIRYHLAAALAQLGRTKEAVKELDAALKSGQLFEGLDEAKILRMRLGE